MKIAHLIDHTLLRPDTSLPEIQKLCSEAIHYGFAAVCVPPYFVSHAAQILAESPVKVATVIGFPMGYGTTQAKVEEIKRAIDDGVDELDVVVNISAIKSGHWNYVKNDIDSITRISHLRGKMVKIIFETGLLTLDEIQKLCEICNQMEVDYVKTSTGVNGGGASVSMVEFLLTQLSKSIKVKASGGIRTLQDAEGMINAGAKRLGCSSSVKIVSSQTEMQ